MSRLWFTLEIKAYEDGKEQATIQLSGDLPMILVGLSSAKTFVGELKANKEAPDARR